MKYEETAEKLAEYRSQIVGIREKMRSAQASTEPEEVQDYEFATPQGKARLSALFGDSPAAREHGDRVPLPAAALQFGRDKSRDQSCGIRRRASLSEC